MNLLSAILLAGTAFFGESKTMALQIALDRAGFSCNTIDGQWGRKSVRALQRFLESRADTAQFAADAGRMTPDEAYARWFADAGDLLRIATVEESDVSAIVRIPTDPAERANLPRMGYESLSEMFAERGHMTESALERLNPGVDWNRLVPGTRIVLPNFPSIGEDLASHAGNSGRRGRRPVADRVVISLGRFEVSVYDAGGKLVAFFPCSVAQARSKLPPIGELKVVTAIPRPNYTYTPDHTPRGQKPKRYVWPEGENCPIGVAWLGLNLAGYGIHGTPRPKTIGRPESHGCFRLSNWNAARLYAMCPPGTRIIIEQ